MTGNPNMPYRSIGTENIDSVESTIRDLVELVPFADEEQKIVLHAPRKILTSDFLEFISKISFSGNVEIELLPNPSHRVNANTVSIQIERSQYSKNTLEVNVPSDLDSDPFSLVIFGHGDGAHIKSGSNIYCGALPLNHHECLPNKAHSCDYERKLCIKSTKGYSVEFVFDLRAQALVLLSCNSISTASESTDRCENIALAGLLGGSKSVVGFTRQIDIGTKILGVLSGFQTPPNSGELVSSLNSIMNFESEGAAVCLGCKSIQLPNLLNFMKSGNTALIKTPPGEPAITQSEVTSFYHELLNLLGINEILSLICRKYSLSEFLVHVEQDSIVLVKSKLLVHAISMRIYASEKLSQDSINRYRKAQELLSRNFGLLCMLGLMNEIADGAGVGDRLTPALRENRTRGLISQNRKCPQCMGIQRTWLSESNIYLSARLESECSACGLLFSVSSDLPTDVLAIDCERIIDISDYLHINLVGVVMEDEIQSLTTAYVQIRNKAENDYLYEGTLNIGVLISRGIRIEVPKNSKPDLHSIRIAWRNVNGIFLLRRLFISQKKGSSL
jgi:hypothetical protein